MNKHGLIKLFEDLAKEYLRSGSAGDSPGSLLKEIGKKEKKIFEILEEIKSIDL